MSAVINAASSPRPAHPDHHVDFYAGDDGFIYDAVAAFFTEGLRVGQPLILLSTPQHRDRIFSLLMTLGADVSAAVANGQLRYRDARETISTFMVGGKPDPQRFTSSLGGILQESRLGREHMTIRVFGEMVDLLMSDGSPEAAVRVEEWWNEFGKQYGFSLLCAYNMGNLYREEHWRYFKRICDEHNHVPRGKNGDLPGIGHI